MQNKRRQLLKLAGLTGMGAGGAGMLKVFAAENLTDLNSNINSSNTATVNNNEFNEKDISIIGLYGAWANAINENKLPAFSYRRDEWKNLSSWKKAAKTSYWTLGNRTSTPRNVLPQTSGSTTGQRKFR